MRNNDNKPQVSYVKNNNYEEVTLFKKYHLILIALLLILAISNCAQGVGYYQENAKKQERAVTNKDEYKNITAENLLEKIKKGEKLFIIDCRPEDEYSAGHLPGAVNFAVYFCIFDKDTVLKVAMEKMIEEKGKKVDLILKDRANKNVYMPKSKIIELLKYLTEDRNQEVIFYCRWPT
jgi:rhodanese-related sulfurtransferase